MFQLIPTMSIKSSTLLHSELPTGQFNQKENPKKNPQSLIIPKWTQGSEAFLLLRNCRAASPICVSAEFTGNSLYRILTLF